MIWLKSLSVTTGPQEEDESIGFASSNFSDKWHQWKFAS